MLWFAFKLVSLNHWIQHHYGQSVFAQVVICFQISIFEPLNTAILLFKHFNKKLWFAFKLVSLNHWIQHHYGQSVFAQVVICFQISIFEPLNTAILLFKHFNKKLWFAFKLVSLNHWIQLNMERGVSSDSCDLLSN